MRILVCDDEKDLNNIVSKTLRGQGHNVDSVFDGQDAYDYIKLGDYDVVILDIMMPLIDGLTVLRRIREEENHVPVLLLTAKDSIDDKVIGLDSGANDYLTKPFSLDELSARIRVLGRKNTGNSTNIFTVSDLSVDVSSHRVQRGGKEIILTPKEYALLEILIRNKGKIVTRTQIENNLWDIEFDGDPNAVLVYVRYLRRKIDDDYDVKLIHTVRGSGYILKES